MSQSDSRKVRRRFLNDGAFLNLIGKWLRVGIMEEDGKVIHPQTGTPQGGVVSPVLANVYLHYALDLWFERVVRPKQRGRCRLIRYADDFVACFEQRHEAEAFERELKTRLAKFGLEVAADKTKTLRFGQNGGPHNGRFDFLGFEFYWTMQTLKAKLQGTWNYYGLIGNGRRMQLLYDEVCRTLYKWLNRRSQRRSITWAALNRLLARYEVPRPRIVEKPNRGMPCQMEMSFCKRIVDTPLRTVFRQAHARAS